MRDFILYSRKGWTTGRFPSMIEGGRLDTVYQCILMGLFLSHRIRRDVTFHAVLNGPPDPPGHLMIIGEHLHDVRVDEGTWEKIFRRVLSGASHPGIVYRKNSFQSLVRSLSDRPIFILEEKGDPVETVDIPDDPVFIIGDHIGLPKNEERFALRYGRRISLGRARYLAASTIAVLNYLMDRRIAP